MKRRDFIKGAGTGALLSGAPAVIAGERARQWKMVTTWPKNFPGLGTGANTLARAIGEMSGGRLTVKVYGAKELVPALEVFDAVSRGTAEMGHGAAYYWKGKSEAAQFFSAVPFGLNAQEMNGWLYQGGGLELWEEVYKPFGVVPVPAGNTTVQMAGWFNKEINSVEDLKGLKMRIPGLGGEVLRRAGGTPVNIPGGDLFVALDQGRIHATEWVGPYNDLAFGLHKAAKYYYYPGWHEPGTTLECIINKEAFDELPKDLKAIVRHACSVANESMVAEYTARNNDALRELVDEHNVDLRRLPDGVIKKLRGISEEVVAELAEKDPIARKVYDSFHQFRKKVMAWHKISERAYYNLRAMD